MPSMEYPEPDSAEIDRVMDLHPPITPEAAVSMDTIRAAYKNLAKSVMPQLTSSAEKSLAWNNLRTSLMYAIAAIACNQDPADG